VKRHPTATESSNRHVDGPASKGRDRTGSARTFRWRGAADILGYLRSHPDATRVEVARDLNLSSSSATEITARLRAVELLTEAPAPVVGRGRPTTVLQPHPRGPLVLAVELRQEDWRCALVTVDGHVHDVQSRRHVTRDPRRVLAVLAAAVRNTHRRHRGRLRAVSLAVAGTVHDDHLVQASTLGWGAVDLSSVTGDTGLPLLVGNDATLAGVAEARTGAAAGAQTALHLLVEVGIGGAVIVDGRPLTGASGAAGEFGHVPFGDPDLHCPCGARGCWDLEVDGRALARHLGAPPPGNPRSYAHQLLTQAEGDPPDAALRDAVAAVAGALARGIAGLVNAHDPEVVVLGGLAVHLRAVGAAAFAAAYDDGLMAFRRPQPPPVLDARYGNDGPLLGAAAIGLDRVTDENALAEWAGGRQGP